MNIQCCVFWQKSWIKGIMKRLITQSRPQILIKSPFSRFLKIFNCLVGTFLKKFTIGQLYNEHSVLHFFLLFLSFKWSSDLFTSIFQVWKVLFFSSISLEKYLNIDWKCLIKYYLFESPIPRAELFISAFMSIFLKIAGFSFFLICEANHKLHLVDFRTI